MDHNEPGGVKILGVNGKEFTGEALNASLRRRAKELEVQALEMKTHRDEIMAMFGPTRRNNIIVSQCATEKYRFYIWNILDSAIVGRRDLKSGIFYEFTKDRTWEISGSYFSAYYDSGSDCHEISFEEAQRRTGLNDPSGD